MRMSSPSPPSSVSAPAPPTRIFRPLPVATRMSLPPRPRRMSLPPPPRSSLARSSPRSMSSPWLPVTLPILRIPPTTRLAASCQVLDAGEGEGADLTAVAVVDRKRGAGGWTDQRIRGAAADDLLDGGETTGHGGRALEGAQPDGDGAGQRGKIERVGAVAA